MASRRERERIRRRRRRLLRAGAFLLVGAIIALIAVSLFYGKRKRTLERQEKAQEIAAEEAELAAKRALIAEADDLAAGYDYDAAIAHLTAHDEYSTDSEVIDAIASYTAAKTNLTTVSTDKVTQIYFQSLIVDTDRAFNGSLSDSDKAFVNAWMPTMDEFDSIIEQLYDNDYVLVRMRDLVTGTEDEDGNVSFTSNSLLLPAGKKPYVLSFDDWNYYHEYEDAGLASRAVLDADGNMTCEYTDASGNVTTGDYDVVPRLNAFFEEHPDGAYKGARGLIGLTGYEGILGWRTDPSYASGEDLSDAQKSWLALHPDFDLDDEIENARAVAEAAKDEGWEFAYHTWGNLKIYSNDLDTAKSDYAKWMEYVSTIVGETDTMIFVPGSDIGDWHMYDADSNEVYAYYKSMGIHYYVTTDSTVKYWVQVGDDHFRMARIACNGYQMWQVVGGEKDWNVFEDLFDVESVFDSARPTPVTG